MVCLFQVKNRFMALVSYTVPGSVVELGHVGPNLVREACRVALPTCPMDLEATSFWQLLPRSQTSY
jgi:hypothetical protein